MKLDMTAKMPPWLEWIMIEGGFKHTFVVEDVTPFNDYVGRLSAALLQMSENGKLGIQFTDEDIGPVLAFNVKDLLKELKDLMK